MRKGLTVGIAAVVLLAVAAMLFFMLRPAPEPTTPPITGPERAEEARAVLAEMRQDEAVDYDAAFSHARRFHADRQLPDAQLLYFFAAREGHAPSAFELGTMNDPLHHSPDTSLLPQPDAFQAYRWYRVAHENGMDDARTRLDELRAWAERAAEAGDAEAERLLLQWQ